ncbi:MAG: hypothetical protein KGI92_11165 [Alphaproteobacteria bacterium]|nr:hypothetical protein [Alphaproteobacteria bacterium]MDE1969454.1 hypothetical protein [Alphaproteobacteria bacterium]MDE2513815.1 hypothetical protein [Alphaproteobacteria bacterium]
MADGPGASTTYREQAARLRALARESASALLRFELLEVAAQFEHLAELAEHKIMAHHKVPQC